MYKIKHTKTGLFKKIDGLMQWWDTEGTIFTDEEIKQIKINPFIKNLEFVKVKDELK